MPLIELDPDMIPNLKLGLHSFQIIFTFVAWCLEIAVFKNDKASITGRNGWTFGVMFISVPAWIYLVMTPRFGRTRKLAQPHVMLGIDVLMTLLWLTAFATQASYNSSDLCGTACGISKAIVALGVFVCLLFAATSFLSGFTLYHYNFHGNLPGYDNRKIRGGENIDPDKAAFSMAPHDEEAYERVNMDDHEATGSGYGAGGGYNSNNNSMNNRYGDANPYSADDDDPNRYGSLPHRNTNKFNNNNNDHFFDSETEYRPGGSPAQANMPYANPPAADPYDDHPAHFPAGNYNRQL